MSAGQAKVWLVAYDIRCKRRLQRVHRALRKEGLAVQYSAFSVEASDAALAGVMERIEGLIDASADDVRAYHLAAHCPTWTMGRQTLGEGAVLAGITAARLLVDTAVETALDEETAHDE